MSVISCEDKNIVKLKIHLLCVPAVCNSIILIKSKINNSKKGIVGLRSVMPFCIFGCLAPVCEVRQKRRTNSKFCAYEAEN